MITSLRIYPALSVTTLLALAVMCQAGPLTAASPNSPSSTSAVQTSGNRVVHRPKVVNKLRQTSATQPATRQSVIARAAAGEMIDEIPQPPLDGTLIEETHIPTHHYAGGCGPVCDCGHCSTDVACGIEGLPAPGCGVEIGCGIGALVETYGPMLGRKCCDDGCDQCCDTMGVYQDGCGIEEIIHSDPACGMESYDQCGCDACTSCDIDCIPLFLPMLRVQWNRFDFFGGVQGYKGPMNFANTAANARNGSGSFGFYQGFNYGKSHKVWCYGWDVATQFGVRTTQSNLSGAEFTDETRNQVFVTGGFFRRVDFGLQYGLVIDYLNQDWYFNGDLTQLRGEVSWRGRNNCHVGGFQFMTGLSDDTSATTVRDQTNAVFNSTVSFESTDQYRFFYRRLLKHNGQWSAFAGWTHHQDSDDVLLGADFSLPIRQRLALAAGMTYLIPEQGDTNGGNEEEGWNLSMGLIFRPGGHNGAGRYSRPLFDVADNGSFLVDRK